MSPFSIPLVLGYALFGRGLITITIQTSTCTLYNPQTCHSFSSNLRDVLLMLPCLYIEFLRCGRFIPIEFESNWCWGRTLFISLFTPIEFSVISIHTTHLISIYKQNADWAWVETNIEGCLINAQCHPLCVHSNFAVENHCHRITSSRSMTILGHIICWRDVSKDLSARSVRRRALNWLIVEMRADKVNE